MASKGQLITAIDYNVLVDSTNKVFADIYPGSNPRSLLNDKIRQGYGWGNTSASLTSRSTKITAALVNEVIDRINLGAEHTGSIYELDRVIKGQKITANIWNDIEMVAGDVDTKHNTSAPGQRALSSLGNISHSSGFNSTLVYTVELEFPSYDRARHFFNSNSCINLNLVGTGSGLSQQWQAVYARLGVVSLTLTNTISTTANVISENKGFRDLKSTEQLLLSCSGSDGGGYGYGYGYGYGNGGNNSYGYGNGGNNSYGYGYGYGGSRRNIKVYGSIVAVNPVDGTKENYMTIPPKLILRVVLSSSDTTAVSGTHTLYTESNKATTKSSGDATFSIAQPIYSGFSSTP